MILCLSDFLNEKSRMRRGQAAFQRKTEMQKKWCFFTIGKRLLR